MKQFIIHDTQFVKSTTVRYITEDILCANVAKSNKEWAIWRDVEKMGIVAKCKNKPRNLVVYGLSWQVAK